MTEGQDTRTPEALPEKVYDLCFRDGRPAVITGAEDQSSWTLRQRSDDSWPVTAIIRRKREEGLYALDCSGSGFTVLTSDRLIDLEGNGQRSVKLSGKMAVGRVTSTYRSSDQLFVGKNAGEWGGGLSRIDLRNGRIRADWRGRIIGDERAPVEKFSCDRLNSCVAVNGITADPWKPACIVVAFGIVHLGVSFGSLAEICGTLVQPIYYKSACGDWHWTPEECAERSRGMGLPEGVPVVSVAFFGLAREGDTLWAVGNDGLYGIGSGGTEHFVPRPQFKDFGGIHVSYDLPQFVLVLTTINQRRSVSGAVPLLVPR
jgi:hypothetical protein